MTARPGMELTSPDALDRLPTGTRVTVNGSKFIYGGYRWLDHPHRRGDIATDELLDRGPVTVLHVPGGAA